MSPTIEPQEWDNELKDMLGKAPAPDFVAWQTKYAISMNDANNATLGKRRELSKRWPSQLARLAASLLLGAGLTWIAISFTTTGRSLFASEIPGVDRVQRLTWTETFYIRVTSADQKRTWIEKERVDIAYQHPGKYRKTHYDRKGEPSFIEVIDTQAKRALTLNPTTREAELKYPNERPDERGPFAWVGDYVRGKEAGAISLKGKHIFDNIEANVVQWKGKQAEGTNTARFYFAVDDKRLVGFTTTNPGITFDPETANEELKQAPEEKWYLQQPIACRTHQVKLDTELGASAFSLDAPEGYKVQHIAKPTVTESDLVTYLGAAAQFNEGVFPDSAVDAFDTTRFNAASALKPTDRTDAAKALIEIRDRIMMREIYRSPVLQFIEDHVDGDSFQYVGAEAKLGDAGNLIAWYRPKGSAKFRAFYGDLSIKELTEKDLPMTTEPGLR